MHIEQIAGKVFRTANGDEYGLIRKMDDQPLPADLGCLPVTPFAEDDCGNYFVYFKSGAVGFWDHEIGRIIQIAATVDDFLAGLINPEPVELKPGQVLDAWIDPEFAESCRENGFLDK